MYEGVNEDLLFSSSKGSVICCEVTVTRIKPMTSRDLVSVIDPLTVRDYPNLEPGDNLREGT